MIGIDVILCIASVSVAYWLRLSEWALPTGNRWIPYFVAPLLALPIYYLSGQYKIIFRYVNWVTLTGLFRATTVYGVIFAILFTLLVVPGVPRTVGVIQPIILLLFIGISRVGARHLLDSESGHGKRANDRRAIIFGAGSAGRQLDAALERIHEMHVVAFVDDDRSLHGGTLHGKAIHGSDDLAALIEKYSATDFLLAIPSASRRRRREIIESLAGHSIKVRIVPGVIDIASGRVEIGELREPGIEDLLGRDMAVAKANLMSDNIAGKTVLVTGAGGSIGSELCRQIIRQGPKTLILLEMSEYNLYAVNEEMNALSKGLVTIVPRLCSVLNEKRIDAIFEQWKPDTIYHAAAYKHVPLVEENASEGLLNNALGTMVMAQVAEHHGADRFVLVSTDKAVRPTNVMGATKRLAEQVLQALAARGSRTCFSMVRFGNVLGSSGSVVPLFRSQIRAGGPVTITDTEMTRYFMTIPEASQLVIQAGALAQGGEVFVLDMGEPVKIIELARRMIKLSGLSERSVLQPDGDIEIRVVGLRPGEKLYEELLIGDNPELTEHPLIMKAHEDFLSWNDLSAHIKRLRHAATQNENAAVKAQLQEAVPEYRPETKSRPSPIDSQAA